MMRFVALALCTIATVHCATLATLAANPDFEAKILQQESDLNPDGSHFNIFETENGIKVRQEGSVKVLGEEAAVHSVQGEFSYYSGGSGDPYVVTYVANENGYQPQGAHLPTPPPVPVAIARALEYIKAHPYVEKQ
ncbi:larval cuticle protein LCP-17-like [Venturia canescens]|uniref:larval cuticle protein LCP-17-like n=1 Tax=Venturia canescens TaxID=32260 RepID=UPI001C9CE123|nr:larval cuticle protein LCP-17-like [Venturia canescens]